MAEATAPATTRPARTRKPAGTAAKATKAATPKAQPAQGPVTEDGKTRVTLELDFLENTKTYAKFTPPKSSGCVGQFYAPLGTETVKVLLIGPSE